MDTIGIIIASLIIGAVIAVIATKMGAFKDKNDNAIPDKIEKKFDELKDKVEELLKK
jgi:uncharacterized membrane-anchored protein YhcB (DUF1043 family)|tara:strand:+ start:4769 stop:4939 length:171 start_codon:yes stop_codon:yes gene_type:complete